MTINGRAIDFNSREVFEVTKKNREFSVGEILFIDPRDHALVSKLGWMDQDELDSIHLNVVATVRKDLSILINGDTCLIIRNKIISDKGVII